MGIGRKVVSAGIAALIVGAATSGAAAQSAMPTGGLSSQPVGHYEFCVRSPKECQPTAQARPVELTRSLWTKIVDINNRVNMAVTPRTDIEMWGVEEYWSYPVKGYGDCEDYVLEKRRLLMKAGVPASNLLITVVRQPNGDGHAVLTVSTHLEIGRAHV